MCPDKTLLDLSTTDNLHLNDRDRIKRHDKERGGVLTGFEISDTVEAPAQCYMKRMASIAMTFFNN